jgi:hypothetical protein
MIYSIMQKLTKLQQELIDKIRQGFKITGLQNKRLGWQGQQTIPGTFDETMFMLERPCDVINHRGTEWMNQNTLKSLINKGILLIRQTENRPRGMTKDSDIHYRYYEVVLA